jgi:hypothetical protein
MRSTRALLLVLLFFVSISAVQDMPAQSLARTDLYHVHFAKAALGKGAEEGDYLKKQSPNAPMPGHYIVLRHQEGEDWDYAVIEHLGTTLDLPDRGPLQLLAGLRKQRKSQPGGNPKAGWWLGCSPQLLHLSQRHAYRPHRPLVLATG